VDRAGWPDLRYVIVSLAADPPDVRAFLIVDGVISEEELSSG
jgi:hypothetical protein